MSDIMLASVGVALLSLIFSGVPFVQLVYILSCQWVQTWEDWGMVTVLMLIASSGAHLYRKLNK